jgi:tetratricopeptide (TPR) repeat protein
VKYYFEIYLQHSGRADLAQKEKVIQSLVQVDAGIHAGHDFRRYKAIISWISAGFSDDIDQSKRLEDSLELFVELGDPWGEATVLLTMADQAQFIGDLAKALRCFQRSYELRRELGCHLDMAESLQKYAGVISLLGQPQKAEPLLREAVELSRRFADPVGLGEGLYRLACCFLTQGRYDEALLYIEEAITVCERIGFITMIAYSLMRKADIKTSTGDYQQAEKDFTGSFLIFQNEGFDFGMGAVKWHLGELALVQDQVVKGRQLLQESVELLETSGGRGVTIAPLALLGLVETKLGDIRVGRIHLDEALQMAQKVRARMHAVIALLAATLYLAEVGKVEQASELLALIMDDPRYSKSIYFMDLAVKPLDQLTKHLSAEIVASAEQRGRQRELWSTIDEILDELHGDNQLLVDHLPETGTTKWSD